MDSISVIKGKVPVLISAPHVFAHYRSSLRMSWKQGEPHTDEIVAEIARRADCYAIFINEEVDYDPNSSLLDENPYKNKVLEIIKDNKIKKFIDIHGLNDKYQYDLGVYYMNRYTRSKKFAYDLVKYMNKGDLRNLLFQVLNFKQNEQETLGEFVSTKLRIPTLQLEIARYIREDLDLSSTLISSIAEYIACN